MKKILILIICLFATGCTVNYSYNIDTKTEKIELLNSNNSYDTDIEKNINQLIDINSDETSVIGYYNFNSIIGKNESGISLDYKYTDYSNYYTYSQFAKCYDLSKSSISRNDVNINITSRINCEEKFDSANISLSVKGELIETNADEIHENNYTWYIEENSDKDIILKVNRTKINDSTDVVKYIYIVLSIILAIIIIAAIILVSKRNQNNKI